MLRKPFHIDPQKFGDSRETAIKGFDRLDRKLTRDKQLHEQYSDYKDLNHMEEIDGSAHLKQESILPHDAVINPSRSRIKLRAVLTRHPAPLLDTR
jgi:hypothetical protein